MTFAREEDEVVDAFFANELVRLCGEASAADLRAVYWLARASLESDRTGSTRLPLDEDADDSILEKHLTSLGASGPEIADVRALADRARVKIPTFLEPVLGVRGERKPLLLIDDCLYQERVFTLEDKFVASLRDRFGSVDVAPSAEMRAAIDELKSSASLSSEQERGLEKALTSRFTLITGGPGTGKTALAVSILRALARLNVPMSDVAVAAPTGRAAQRMVDAMARALTGLSSPAPADVALLAALPPASTLHRLLDYAPKTERFLRHERNPIPASYVLVDEGSMIDLVLATRLVRSLRTDAHLILLGDAQQLPSVETGAVFRDLVRAAEAQKGLPHLVRLTKSYRMDIANESGKHVFDFAARVLVGDKAKALSHAVVRNTAHELQWKGVERAPVGEAAAVADRFFDEHLVPPADLDAFVQRTLLLDASGSLNADDATRVRELLLHHDRARILTATRTEGNELSAARLNKRLHMRMKARVHDEDNDSLRPGEPVMMQRNDYRRGLFNGDQGVALRALAFGASDPTDMCAFSTSAGFVVVPLASLESDISLSYATTVHKAQGSEFDHVLFLLPNTNLPILTRDLLYTAVTRARTSVTLVADPESLARTVECRAERFSGVADRLR